MNRTALVTIGISTVVLSVLGVMWRGGRLAKPDWTLQDWPPRGERILFLGDETASAAGASAESSQKTTGIDKTKKGRQLSDLTVESVRSVLDETKPHLVILAGGFYDVGSGKSWKRIWGHYEVLIKALRDRQVATIFVGVIPPKMDNFSFGFRDVSRDKGVFLVEHALKEDDIHTSGYIDSRVVDGPIRQRVQEILNYVYR